MLARVGFCGPGTYCFFWASHGCQKSQIRHTQDAMLCAAADKFVIVSNRQLGGQQAFRKLRGLERTRSPVGPKHLAADPPPLLLQGWWRDCWIAVSVPFGRRHFIKLGRNCATPQGLHRSGYGVAFTDWGLRVESLNIEGLKAGGLWVQACLSWDLDAQLLCFPNVQVSRSMLILGTGWIFGQIARIQGLALKL